MGEKYTSVTTSQKWLLASSGWTHLWDPFFAPLADSFADTDYTLHDPVQSLLDFLQSWNHGDVRNREGHVYSEDRLLDAVFLTSGWVAFSLKRWEKSSSDTARCSSEMDVSWAPCKRRRNTHPRNAWARRRECACAASPGYCVSIWAKHPHCGGWSRKVAPGLPPPLLQSSPSSSSSSARERKGRHWQDGARWF